MLKKVARYNFFIGHHNDDDDDDGDDGDEGDDDDDDMMVNTILRISIQGFLFLLPTQVPMLANEERVFRKC